MTKEEKVFNNYYKVFFNKVPHISWPDAEDAINEAKKSQSIAFAEWKDTFYAQDPITKLFCDKQAYLFSESSITFHTNESLYTLFLQSLTSKEK